MQNHFHSKGVTSVLHKYTLFVVEISYSISCSASPTLIEVYQFNTRCSKVHYNTKK
eukprot:NODE_757_length_626_cov_194.354709_g748_i0.p2 GENE.NODE_757_length_626_cov_194.354709_g748_i0~~NODE_757_length_626_cov_194.354709_g748_i0.p2  ORF type:complete len:56 (-),score=2.27 NODE_757_length_626_cov_194.354709_g748_i0:231-398(-)